MAAITGGQAIVRCLENQGVEYAFGLAGHANLALLDALVDSKIKYISFPHEQIATHAADAYFRVTHRPAVVLTTVGPGATNVVPALADALLDSSAVLVICGGIPSFYAGTDAYQEIGTHSDDEQADIFKPLTKRTFRVAHARLLPSVVSRALNYALAGNPGPVMVHVPLDFLSQRLEYDDPDVAAHRPTSHRQAADESGVEHAFSLLVEAERPLIFAGNGVLLAGATAELTAFAERLQIPVATTMSGQGAINEEHALAAGFTGVVGTPAANRLAREADVILAIGTRMPEMDCNSWAAGRFFQIPPAKLIQVDLSPHEVGKIYPVAVGLVGDAGATLTQLLRLGQESGIERGPSEWAAQMQAEREEWWAELREAEESDEKPIARERILGDIRSVLPPDGILVTGVGVRHSVAQHIRFTKPLTQIVGSGYSTMGQEVAAALGAKLGRPDVPVIALVGDGAFRSTMQSLLPAVEYGINVVWVIENNYSFNIIALYQRRHWDRLIGTQFKTEKDGAPYNPDFAAMARACGAEGRRIEEPRDLRGALVEALNSERPYVLDVVATERPRGRASGYWVVNDILSKSWSGHAI